MAKYIQRIMTADGEKQIDYNALANLPIIPDVSDEIEERVAALEAGKLDKVEKPAGIWVYSIANGENRLHQCNTTPTSWTLPIYSTNGVLYTADPSQSVSGNANLACANKKYVDDLGATKLDKYESSTGGNYLLYGVDSNGQSQRMYPTNSNNHSTFVARWGASTGGTTNNGGYLTTADPVNLYHAANKNYVDTNLEGKLDKFTVQGNAGNKVYRARADGGQDTVFIGDSPDYIATYLSGSSTRGDNQPSGYLVSHNPSKPYHTATKKYVDDVKSELEMLGLFYKVVKVTSGGSQWVEIPEGAMTTAYIESATFDAYHTEKGLVYSGTADHLYFENNQGIVSDTSITAPTYFQIPEGATQIRVNCDECIPSDVDWDAGPVTFTGYIYFQVKRG